MIMRISAVSSMTRTFLAPPAKFGGGGAARPALLSGAGVSSGTAAVMLVDGIEARCLELSQRAWRREGRLVGTGRRQIHASQGNALQIACGALKGLSLAGESANAMPFRRCAPKRS